MMTCLLHRRERDLQGMLEDDAGTFVAEDAIPRTRFVP
jgi:hypothetical protein